MENNLNNIFFFLRKNFSLGWRLRLVWLVGSFFVFFHFLRNIKWVHTSWLSHPPLSSHMIWTSNTVKLYAFAFRENDKN